MYDGGDAALYTDGIIEGKEIGCKIRLVFGDEEVCCDATDGAWDADGS